MDKNTVAKQWHTSASALGRRMLCPGSARMEFGLPDDDSEFARRGTLLHRYAMDKTLDRSFLKPDDRDLLDKGEGLLLEVLARLNFGASDGAHVETPIVTADGRLPGRPDTVFVWFVHDALLVHDWKFGFNPVDRAELNLQLRGYAVLGYDNYAESRPTNVYVSIIQPRLSYSERVSLACYKPDDIAKARQQIIRILDATEPENAPLVPGDEQCRYCKARGICPALRDAIVSGVVALRPDDELTKTAKEAIVVKRLAACTDDQLGKIFEAVKLAEFVGFPVRDEIRRRIGAGQMGNYYLGKPAGVREIGHVRRAIALLTLGRVATRDELLGMATLPLHAIEELYRSRNKGTTWKEAREKIDKVLKSVLDVDERKPRILKK